MTGTFKIRKDKLKSIVFQDLKNISLIALISILFPIVMMTIIMPKEDMPIYIPIISLIFSISVIAGIIAYMYNFKIVYYEAYELTISEKGLHKRIDLDNNKMLSGLRAWAWNRLKLLSKQHDTFIDWDKIKSVKRLKRGLLIKARYTDLYGYGLIAIPGSLVDFDQIKKYIDIKIKAD